MRRRKAPARTVAALVAVLALALAFTEQPARADQPLLTRVPLPDVEKGSTVTLDPPDSDPCKGDHPGTACGPGKEKDPCAADSGKLLPACGGAKKVESEMERCKAQNSKDNACLNGVATDGAPERNQIKEEDTRIDTFSKRQRENETGPAKTDTCKLPVAGMPVFKKEHYVFAPDGCVNNPRPS
ncbi:hypothetical protein [Streptomyces sp. NPDC046261]|uniref:hypothetical protein n=1 Tax=Streptomyces sp. NPDC046261 TaxID=3157200 RepID=UPI0033D947E3